MRAVQRDRNNIFLVVIFAICVLFLILISLSIKFIGVVQDSKYSSGRFTLLLLDSENEGIYLSVDEEEKIGSQLVVKNIERLPTLPIGADGIVKVSSDVNSEKSPASLVSEMLIKRNEQRLNITFLDLIRMYIAFRTIPSEDVDVLIAEKEADVPFSRLPELFEDRKIVDEDKTISIENATDIPGVATKLENVITTMGGNVISVESSVTPQPHSQIISYGRKSYTSDKIQSFLGYPIEEIEDQQVADISIIIGEDGFGNLIFPEGGL